ncbi:MAG TPA: DUF4215 domain-containing protein, partial [Polyangiales bacterium]|nr:DUF4215 domain-containing protein [Polyangiales bacterium]
VCGDGFVTAPETCEPGGTATCNDSCTARAPVCGDTFITSPETCDDGNAISGDGCDSSCQLEFAGEEDLTQLGVIIAAVPNPLGGGNKDIEVIRDGDKPAPGTGESSRQFDTWDGVDASTEDWIGYEYLTDYAFSRVLFQEGRQFWDGGWFDSLTVQIRQGGVWVEAPSVSILPTYGGENGLSFETYELVFLPTTGDAIRIYGNPGGYANFISVGELEVFGNAAP